MKTLRHVVAGVLATLFVLIAGPAFAQSNIRVDGFDVEQVPELSPGTQLNFSVFGTPGAQASLRIAGAAAQVTLVEVQPGVYEGSYTIAEQDRIMPESRVIARLRLHEREVMSVLGEPLLLGMNAAPAAAAEAAEPAYPAQAVPPVSAPMPREPRYAAVPQPRYAAVPQPSYAAVPQPSYAAVPEPRYWAEPRYVPAPSCPECGVVEAIDRSGSRGGRGVLGSVVGGVVGAIFGNQFGRGEGRSAARILGALGGAVAGREIERRNTAAARYDLVVRLEGGARQTFAYDSPPPFRVGDRVRLADGSVLSHR